jgi:hypothetical protein
MLAWLSRESCGLLRGSLKLDGGVTDLRSPIKAKVTRRKNIPTSVKVPLTSDSKKGSKPRPGEAERLGQRYLKPQQTLLGIFKGESSLATGLSRARAFNPQKIRVQPEKRHRADSRKAGGELGLRANPARRTRTLLISPEGSGLDATMSNRRSSSCPPLSPGRMRLLYMTNSLFLPHRQKDQGKESGGAFPPSPPMDVRNLTTYLFSRTSRCNDSQVPSFPAITNSPGMAL